MLKKYRVICAVVSLLVTMPSVSEELSWSVEPSIGYDSNVYRAPSSTYIDYGKTCTPVGGDCQLRDDAQNHQSIDPSVQSGLYSNIKFNGEYLMGLSKATVLNAEYTFSGRFYADSKYNNANQYYHKISVGAQHTVNVSKKKKDNLYVGLIFGHKKKLYLDRDTGVEQEFSNQDVSERYTYDMHGAEIWFKKKTGKIHYKLDAVHQVRDYRDEVVISEYDHSYSQYGGEVDYRLDKPTKLSMGYDYSIYDYKDRPARNDQGDLFSSSPKRKYQYSTITATMRHRFYKDLVAYFGYENKQRTDDYLGYDNYEKNMIKTRILYKYNNNNKLKASFSFWERTYPNAFAFDNFIKNISKKYDGKSLKLELKARQDKRTSLISTLRFNEDDSTDLRYGYDRYQLSFGVAWES